MDKLNSIHILTLLLAILASCVSAECYHIAPSINQCQSYSRRTCFTLAEFASNSSHLAQDNLTLNFLPGEHPLKRRIKFNDFQNITLTGQNSSNKFSTIKCQGTSGFEFRDIQSLIIANLKFTGCGNVKYGGAILINRTKNVLIRGCHFTNNHVVGQSTYGGAIYAQNTMIMNIEGNMFDNNNAGYCGGAIYVNSGNIYPTSDQYINNSANQGGAIYVDSGNISSTSDQYISNSADNLGGAIYVYYGNIYSTSDQYINNSADNLGGAIHVSYGNIYSRPTSDQYINNRANQGGAIYVIFGNIYSTSDQYINNSADNFGGAIYISYGNIYSNSDQYINNSADNRGQAINVDSIYSMEDQYINGEGGAIYIYYGSIFSTSDQYINNSANYGGAISVFSGDIYSTSDQYLNNSANGDGGAINVIGEAETKLSVDIFEKNLAVNGAVIYTNHGALEIAQCNITDNSASSRGTVYMIRGSLSFSDEVNFMNNRGSLYVFNTQVEFKGAVIFRNNLGVYGGAISAFLSKVSFNTPSTIIIRNNTAANGGGIFLTQSNLHVYHSIELTDNHATDFGGGIYAYQSDIVFQPELKQSSEITKNTGLNGGAICAIASNIHISNTYMDVNSNRAEVNGGAIYLDQNSKIYVQKQEQEGLDTERKIRLDFTNNSAEKGGAIYVADNTNDGMLCQGTNTETYQTECFIQTLTLYHHLPYNTGVQITPLLINTFFTNNKAYQSGSDIYGGLLDRCTINQISELLQHYPKYKKLSGFFYVTVITQIEQIVDYSPACPFCPPPEPNYFIDAISRSDVKGLISSDAVQVEFCLNNVISPNYDYPNVSIMKGEMFTVSLAAVDQVGNPVNATIITSFQSKSGNGRLKEGQVEQQVGNQCTELQYNVYSQDNSAQIQIHADGPCGDKGVSRKTLNVIFLPCMCPVGFESSSGPSKIDCICECDQKLTEHQITSCSAVNETIQVETNIWIGLCNYTNETEYVVHDCPFDYCVEKPVNISLSSPDSIDEQCAYHRTGILCGMCQEDLSLVFGSSRCKECSDNYISLLIPFALAGIALVTFILLINMTVATGIIYGLIFYANILTANYSLFLPPSTSNFLTVFISWLNLDLGIETCFYDGMDSYGKFLLQLAFPTYVYILIGAIIALCEVSKKFATLLGNRNPVAALCTLILLSYAKLIRTIITALQFTQFDYPDCPREIVWLYDANVQYFTVSHIPRFIAAFVIIILGTIYTIILLFGQWFPRCSNRKIMKWTKNTKYNAFIDAYHAPFTPKHRYWVGLLLFAQIILNIVAAMTTGPFPILSVACVALGLILFRVINTRIYKNSLQDSLETLFLINIVILSVATYHIRVTSEDQLVTYHIRETNDNQLALSNTSMAISFILFLIILSYHFYKYILKGTRIWASLTQQLQRVVRRDRQREFDLVPLDDDDDHEEDEQPIEMQPPYTNDNDADSIDLPHVYDPPVIVPAVRYDQLREPDLDILDPITTDDYRQLNQPPAPRPRQVPTSTVIDFVRPRRNVDRPEDPS